MYLWLIMRAGSKRKPNSKNKVRNDYIEEEKEGVRVQRNPCHCSQCSLITGHVQNTGARIYPIKLSKSIMCQEKLKPKASETTFPSVQRRGRKEAGLVIEADGVKLAVVRGNRASQPHSLPCSPSRTEEDEKIVWQGDHITFPMGPEP